MVLKRKSLVASMIMICALVTVDASAQEGMSSRSLRKMARGAPRAQGGGLAGVCPTVKPVTGKEFLYKSEISHHISKGDARSSGPTLVCNRVCPKFPAPLYYSDGTEAARLGYYGRWNVTGKARAYCAAGGAPACSNSALNRNARARGRDGKLYLKINGSTCYRVNPIGRTGSPT
jgi:hypothetical protein